MAEILTEPQNTHSEECYRWHHRCAIAEVERLRIAHKGLQIRIGEQMKHDHRRSLWVIGNGSVIWCYRCGAWRPNIPGRMQWHKPTGPNGKNPAMKDIK